MPKPRLRQADDDIFRVHSRYLGPPGFTLPFSIPYAGILPGLAAGLGTLVLLSLLGLGAWRFLLTAGVAVAVGALVGRHSGGERPFWALPAMFTHESGAPRPTNPRPSSAVLRPGRVPVRELPMPRREEDRT
jgi:hypothetical protein